MSSQLQQENMSLKKQVTILRKQLALNKQQQAEQHTVHSSKHKSFRTAIIPESPGSNEINHLEPHNTLSATFDALQSNHQTYKTLFSKYEQMRQIGVSIDIIVLQMRKDKMTENIITEFSQEINSKKYRKYNAMKTSIPIESILNTMKSDGLSQSEIDIFCSDLKESEFGLPSKLQLSKPGHKMKHIHWKSIKLEKINDSIWSKMNHEWDDYDNKTIESKFKVKLNAIKLDETHLTNSVSVSFSAKHRQKKEVNFIPPNRSEQVRNALKSFDMTNNELRKVILAVDDMKLSVNHVKILLEIIPTPCEQLMAERMSQLKNVKLFGVTERFFYSLCDIIEIRQRINNWVFKLEFKLRVEELIEQINIMESAKLMLILSKEFREILKIILGFGNYMNYGKTHGNAYGFCISDLNLLQEIKTSDNSVTFLMYLCSFLKRKYPNLLDIIERFKIVHEAALINGGEIDKRYRELIQEVRDLDTLVIRYKDEHYQIPNSHDMFYPKMVNFQNIIREKLSHLKLKIDTLHLCEEQLIKYFGFETDINLDTVNIQKIFQFISTFILELQYSNINLKQFEQIKKKIRSNKKRNHKKGQRRARTATLTRNGMKKYASVNCKQQHAVALEDVGTPIIDEQENIYDNRMNIFDENKTSEYSVCKPRPQLSMSQSADQYVKPSPLPKKTNIISFGRFNEANAKSKAAVIHSYDYSSNYGLNINAKSNVNSNGSNHSNAVIHSYNYSGNYGSNIINNIDEGKTEKEYNKPSLDMNAAIIHTYHSDSEPSSPISEHNKENSFYLCASNSELIQQKFGAVLESPRVDNLKRHKNNSKMHNKPRKF